MYSQGFMDVTEFSPVSTLVFTVRRSLIVVGERAQNLQGGVPTLGTFYQSLATYQAGTNHRESGITKLGTI